MKIQYHKIYSFLLLMLSMVSLAQFNIKFEELEVNALPKKINYKGMPKKVVKWKDKNGYNIVITSETGIISGKANPDANSAELYAFHFLLNGDSVKQTWKVNDFIKECQLDIEANFIDNTFAVTDLNNDGVAEIWLMYKTVCHGDVSPADMKIIMYQGQQKFAMRGRNKVKVSETQYEGGEYLLDKAFTSGPKSFTEYAKKLWSKNIM